MARAEPQLSPASIRDPWRWVFLATLVLAAGLRIVLVARGGQYFWPDEARYHVAEQAAGLFATGDLAGGLQVLLRTSDHLLFKVIGTLPAWFALETGAGVGPFFALFSVANIALLWPVARRAGASPREAALAVGLFACANSGFYYARHLLPYDAALTFGLLAMVAGWSGDGWRRSLGCGVLAGAGFLTYNGSWLFGGMVLVGHVLLAGPSWRRMMARAAVAGAGLVLPIVAVIGLARLTGADLVEDFLRFSHTVNQGDFGGGWRLVREYFWQAEGWNAVGGLAALALTVAGATTARRWTYGLTWVAGAAFILAGLLLFADFWSKFVVYGRTARQLTPLVCLAAAYAGERLWRAGRGGRWLAGVAGVVILAQAVVNFAGPLAQVFPPRFRAQAVQRIAELQAAGDQRQLLVIHTDHLLDEHSLFDALPDHDTILAAPNPMAWIPYQLEGAPEKMRARLAAGDLRMRLIAVNRAWFSYPVRLREPYPGVVQLTVRLPQDRWGRREPLVVTGTTGRGDLLYLVYEAPGKIRLGMDHWGIGAYQSDPIEVNYAEPQVFTVSVGPLHSPEAAVAETTLSNQAPDLRDWLYVKVNDRVVWSQPAHYHRALPSTITYGTNYIGGSTCDMRFSGEITDIKSLLLPNITPYRSNLRQPHPGAVRLALRLPVNKPGVREPLLLAGRTGEADMIYVIYDSPATIRLGFDHWGVGGFTTEPIPVDYSQPVTVTLSAGFLHEASAPAAAGMDPRKWLYAEVNGRVVWSQPAEFYASSPDSIALVENAIGASTAEPRFSGKLLEIESVALPPAIKPRP